MNALKVTLQSNEFNIVVEEGISLKKRDGKRQLVERLKVNVIMHYKEPV